MSMRRGLPSGGAYSHGGSLDDGSRDEGSRYTAAIKAFQPRKAASTKMSFLVVVMVIIVVMVFITDGFAGREMEWIGKGDGSAKEYADWVQRTPALDWSNQRRKGQREKVDVVVLSHCTTGFTGDVYGSAYVDAFKALRFRLVETGQTGKLGDAARKQDEWPKWDLMLLCVFRRTFAVTTAMKTQKPYQMIMSLPGRIEFAHKAGLWKSFKDTIGVENATAFLPMTWIVSNVQVDEVFSSLVKYGIQHPERRFVVKRGHRQKGLQVYRGHNLASLKLEDLQQVKVVQELVENVFLYQGKAKTAARIYTWCWCTDNGKTRTLNALLDWNAPFYVARPDNPDVASGYSNHDKVQALPGSFTEFLEKVDPSFANALKQSAVRAVHTWKSIHQHIACGGGARNDNGTTMYHELFSIDLIPLEDGTVRLLEVNRFSDMDTRSPLVTKRKRLLKTCTVVYGLGIQFYDDETLENILRRENCPQLKHVPTLVQ